MAASNPDSTLATDLTTLSALLSAVVFSTTFLAGRIRGEVQRAMDRASTIDTSLESSKQNQVLVHQNFLKQAEVVKAGRRLGLLPLGLLVMNVAITLLSVGLAIAFDRVLKVPWNSWWGHP